MTKQLDLLRDWQHQRETHGGHPGAADICARKHGGNAHSAAANDRAGAHKHTDRDTILKLIRESSDGLTLKELCAAMRRLPNEVSGRLTELKTGRYKNGTVSICVRGTRNNCGVHFPL